MLSAVELAALALKVLDTQRLYFKTRDHETLLKSKTLETELRLEASMILSKQDTLFQEVK